MDLPNKKYKIIYADPPWKFKVWKESMKSNTRSASVHYPVMDFGDLLDLPVRNIADDDSVLFLWVINPLLHKSFDLISAWGFTYKTVGFSWVKRNKKSDGWFFGLGYYTRANVELCFLCTRGKPLKRISRAVPQLVDAKIMEHSRKPSVVRDRIVELFGDLPRIELFSRERVDGWDAWGNEI